MDLQFYLRERKILVEQALINQLDACGRWQESRLQQAMHYSLMAGGKRLRPILLLACCEAVGGETVRALPFACALECIHTYSLIHDDLPAMDNDDLRRGQPTCHRQFDEGTAILAGDALLTWAFELAAQSLPGLPGELQLTLLRQLAQAAGQHGMVGGQMLDLLAEGQTLSLAEMQNIHVRKTGALLRISCLIGASLGGGSPQQIKQLTRYGEAFGLAFQITDDILDETGDPALMGKSPGSDRKKAKSTYPVILGLPQAREEARIWVEEAENALKDLSETSQPLRLLARHLLSRTS
ncbi:MAG: polyprenyl synthetase family protein [Magnetococcales bacterium]|nr:polyprenyl synthetase family protein [Magnetococcales bacterium]